MATKKKTEFMSKKDLCELLDISESTANRLLNERQIPAFKIGTVWKIPRKSVDTFIENKLAETN